ncbi:UDP-3-O-[3-hydroxymyristoyl] glucosamine N-acyltransferase [hydrothermal vent metagenome]|uniref:UDP-3-O-[3-hydroxymyristoyl] glucosamine N-acyltransferase n=1 Tax=hydrothermal vent metagenome TaxID=652676 RepID=A0A3B1D7E5_9ZZZZ
MKSFFIEELAKVVNGVLVGEITQKIIGPEQIELANKNQITFIGDAKYLPLWKSSQACAAIVNEKFELESGVGRALIKVKNADLSMAQLLELFNPDPPLLENEIHASAVVHPTVKIGKNVSIGAGCYIGKDVVLSDQVKLYPNVTVLDQTCIGAETIIWSGTVIRERCQIGKHCIFHPNVSIGADGFGYRPSLDGKGLVKIPQIGNVIIGDDVEIGSGSCVDRGKFSSTIIGDGCKIDNLVQIAHNCKLGRSCIMSGNSGLAGSVTLGDGVVIAGTVSIKDHVTIGNGAIIGGGSIVIKDVIAGKKMLGYPALEYKDTLKHWAKVRKSIKN